MIVGCLSYRGYFDKNDAQALASQLRDEGMDVIVSGAAAYSTLGWMDDPLLNTVVQRSDASMVGIIFHELAHQVVYVEGDSAFNEAFATSVEDEGLRRWYTLHNNKQAYLQYRDKKAQQQMIYRQLEVTREQLDVVYRQSIPDEEKQRKKEQIFAGLKKWYQDWRKTHQYAGFDDWMSKELNNAHLALIATYQQMVPDFLTALQSVDGDMKKYFELVNAMATLDNAQRRQQLAEYRTRLQAKN
jgi:predicted aminopeptidase